MSRLLKFFDIKSAVLGCLIMGLIVGWINSSHGLDAAISSGIRQAIYTFFVAGLVAQLCRWLTVRNFKTTISVTLAVGFPTLLTVVMVYILHSARGTPEPFYSAIPVAVLSLLSFSVIAWDTLNEDSGQQQANDGGSEHN